MINHDITSRAILLHQNKQTKAVEVTTHDIIKLGSSLNGENDPNRGRYTLGAGQVFGAEQKAELSAILNEEQEHNGLSLIPEYLLAQTAYAVVWWMPGQVREQIVATQDGRRRFRIKMPGSVAAMCRGSLYVAATKGAKRPDSETPLFRMPITNLTSDFSFCMGNIRLPREARVDHIPTWSAGIWETTNTHLGRSPLKGVNTQEDYIKLLEQLDGKGRFPTQKLIPAEVTLGQFLAALENRG